ncbi:MAG: peptidylprolyl isomerase [Prolixibacteraceae bacterium]|nr:peptidylprolyl isomerase [Prolixibacteraceae bacterium]
MKQIKKQIAGIFILLLIAGNSVAQDKVIDQVVAVVGGNYILKSDIENMNMSQQAQGITSEGDMKCEILENFLVDKLLVAEAELDTLIEVTPSEANMQVDRQIQMYITYLGSEKAVEDEFGKSIVELRAELQGSMRDQLMSQKMREKIVADVEVTPSEVRYYYRNLNRDELLTIPTQYEYQQITIQPRIDIEEENRVKAELREIKRRIENGSSFAAMAIAYSEDGSAKDGGVIGYLGRAQLDPAYASAAFSLKGDNISNVVKSQFGYHIIQLVDKKGEKVNTRHILIKPKISAEAKELAYNQLDSLANMLRNNEIAFNQAAQLFSYDTNSKNNGGVVINPNTMSSKFSAEELDPDVSKVLTSMEINEISKPFETIDSESHQTVYKIIKLTNKIDSHKANLQEDYQQLAEDFLINKKEEVFEKWVKERQAETYIRIDATYANCNFSLSNWIK